MNITHFNAGRYLVLLCTIRVHHTNNTIENVWCVRAKRLCLYIKMRPIFIMYRRRSRSWSRKTHHPYKMYIYVHILCVRRRVQTHKHISLLFCNKTVPAFSSFFFCVSLYTTCAMGALFFHRLSFLLHWMSVFFFLVEVDDIPHSHCECHYHNWCCFEILLMRLVASAAFGDRFQFHNLNAMKLNSYVDRFLRAHSHSNISTTPALSIDLIV